MIAGMDQRERIDRILAELSDPGGFEAAEQRIGAIAPQLQSTLDRALAAGGWFDDAHEGAVLKAATTPDGQTRIDAVRDLVLEQTRLGMLVGVAVGWEIADRLARASADDVAEPPGQDDQAVDK
jgi:hypothetical protein